MYSTRTDGINYESIIPVLYIPKDSSISLLEGPEISPPRGWLQGCHRWEHFLGISPPREVPVTFGISPCPCCYQNGIYVQPVRKFPGNVYFGSRGGVGIWGTCLKNKSTCSSLHKMEYVNYEEILKSAKPPLRLLC